jgi:hypothetical protein
MDIARGRCHNEDCPLLVILLDLQLINDLNDVLLLLKVFPSLLIAHALQMPTRRAIFLP